ncbi:uncharacterized protein LOC142322791 [Lycorma delicatula]|uniref:uncharacterized protein LOC142322791 n=1 Tax=Lycorma delicatula TaxID=130591 RepID=UPI003F5178EF
MKDDGNFSTVSPFLFAREISKCVGRPAKEIKKTYNGLHVETTNDAQSQKILELKNTGDFGVYVDPHGILSTAKGVVVSWNLLNCTEQEIVEELAPQGVIEYKVRGEAFEKLLAEESEIQGKGSGWSLISIDGLMLRINKFKPLRGSSYIDLPDKIKQKKAVINVNNKDICCFKWAILSKHVTSNNPQRLDKRYTVDLESTYDFSMLKFPVEIKDVKKFESAINVSINVYTLTDNDEVRPLKVCQTIEKPNHFDLLYLKKDDVSHYCYIKDFSRLVRS